MHIYFSDIALVVGYLVVSVPFFDFTDKRIEVMDSSERMQVPAVCDVFKVYIFILDIDGYRGLKRFLSHVLFREISD